MSVNKPASESESVLHDFAKRTFLSLWSLPNLYRDQGKANGRQGKELADLVVVFGRDVLIFSDKHCQYYESTAIDVSWKRWYRKSVLGSVRSLYGAIDWIRTAPHRVFIDRDCTKRCEFFDEHQTSDFRFHLIAVASGASEACKKHFGGGSGSLIVEPDGETDQAGYPEPFHLPDVAPSKPFVHVFDSPSLRLIFYERSTIVDFIEYLVAREQIVRSRTLISATGEEDLLGWYLSTFEPGIGRRFGVKSNNEKLVIAEGIYVELIKRPEYIAGKCADQCSFLVDSIIERFVYHGNKNELMGPGQTASTHERLLRALASENRVQRRALAEAWIDQAKRIPPGQMIRRVIVPTDRSDRIYVSVMMQPVDHPPEEYRRRRRVVLNGYAIVAADEYPHAQEIIGLATEGYPNSGRSYDLLFMDLTNRPSNLRTEAEFFRKKFGFFNRKKMLWGEQHLSEYPSDPVDLRVDEKMTSTKSEFKSRRRKRKQERNRKRTGRKTQK